MEAFHAAYSHGELVQPPDDYMDLILIPAVLHTSWSEFAGYPLAIQERIRALLMFYLAAGQGMRPPVRES